YFLPFAKLSRRIEGSLVYNFSMALRPLQLNQVKHFSGIVHTPCSNPIGIPVIIDVVLIFVGAGNTQYHIFLFIGAPIHTLRPKTADRDQYLQTVVFYIFFVACVAYIVEDGIGDGSVTVNFFKSNLPFIVALFAKIGR